MYFGVCGSASCRSENFPLTSTTIQTCLAALGMGLGKDLQGMANKLEATANKGKAGLGLGITHTFAPATTPDYSPQPDTAILTNDHAALSFEEMEWWRIMEQRKPAKLLRSKFLPQDDILLALRTAREMSHAWQRDQLNSSDDTSDDQFPTDAKDSAAEGGWAVPLLIQTPKTEATRPTADAESGRPGAAPGSPGVTPNHPRAASNSPEATCLHQAPCVAPQGLQHSRSFWNMASLNSAFDICSNLAAMQQPNAELDILDLSVHDCGATEYVVTHGGVRVQSAQVLSGEAVQKLQRSASNVAGAVQALLPGSSPEPNASAMQALSAMTDAAAVTHAAVTDSTHMQTAAPTAAADCDMGVEKMPTAVSAAHTLESFESVKAGLKAAHLVIGNLGRTYGQGSVGREKSQMKGSNTDGQNGEGSGQEMVPTVRPQEGVMEAEYADDYRARLLWECAVALSSLETGTALLV